VEPGEKERIGCTESGRKTTVASSQKEINVKIKSVGVWG
jgi:hypothetical protein